MEQVGELVELLRLEQLEVNLFRGQSTSIGSGRVFGGQVMAQSLSAATQTVPSDRFAHSLHAYFVRPGDLTVPIIFEVERIRDGGSFTTRRVKAIQHGQAIFHLSASFQLEQMGFEHQIPMPNVPVPAQVPSAADRVRQLGDEAPASLKRMLAIKRPIEFRPVELIDPMDKVAHPPYRNIWMRAKGTLPTERYWHTLTLAYAADYNLLTTALLPHQSVVDFRSITIASLDHAMWFHRPFRMDEWLLYALDSPSAAGGRGFTRGNIFNEAGQLVASVVQEGLMRPKQRG